MASEETHVRVEGRSIRISSPSKQVFPATGWTKLDLVEHYLRCGDAALAGVLDRPCLLKRWPRGAGSKPFFQKRVEQFKWRGKGVPVTFPAAKPGTMPIVTSVADIIEMIQLGCIDLNPWPVRSDDVDHPDELRIDLDPTAGVAFSKVRIAAQVIRDILTEDGLVGWPKTSGGNGLHIYVRIEPHWRFRKVRRACLALAREAARRAPKIVTTEWWKEDRFGVFVDYNQNARDKTVASAFSPRESGLVSTPFDWQDLSHVDPRDFRMDTFDRHLSCAAAACERINEDAGRLEPLLERVRLDEKRGLGEAPWPPHYPKMPGEPPRVRTTSRSADD